MENSAGKFVLVLICLLMLPAAAPAEPNQALPAAKAYVIPCKGLIDNGLFESIRRRTQIALDQDAQYIIYEISTYGGLLKSGDDIAKYFLETGTKAKTVAYIKTEAISAGAMISVSCRDIIMRNSSTIGSCAPVMMGGKL